MAVWLAAIIGAVSLHERVRSRTVATGYAEARRVTIAHSELGVVRHVHVHLHEYVGQGQILVSLDDQQERIQLAAMEKDIERLQAEVAAQQAVIAADNARAVADVRDLARRFAIDRDAAHVDYLAQIVENAKARISLDWAETELEITQGLRNSDHAAYRELNDIETEADSLRAEVAWNDQLLDQKRTAFNEADRRYSCFTTENQVVTTSENLLAPLRLAIDVRRRELDELVLRLDSHVLRAPMAG